MVRASLALRSELLMPVKSGGREVEPESAESVSFIDGSAKLTLLPEEERVRPEDEEELRDDVGRVVGRCSTALEGGGAV